MLWNKDNSLSTPLSLLEVESFTPPPNAENDDENFDLGEDGNVEDSEIEAQGKVVESLIEKLENQLSAADFELVSNLISELSVFQLISNDR